MTTFSRTARLSLSALVCAACLTGCGRSSTPVAVSLPVPPPERLRCAAEPAVPTQTTDASVAQYIVDLAAAGQSCRSAVGWLRDWSAGLNKK